MRIFVILLLGLYSGPCLAVSVVGSAFGIPITDADVSERRGIMPDLRGDEIAKAAIMDDYIKLEYARQLNIEPSEKDAAAVIKEHKNSRQMVLAVRAAMAWQAVIARSIIPAISVSDEEIRSEAAGLEKDKDPPVEITFIKLFGISEYARGKLAKPADCKEASGMARGIGAEPLEITALESELAPDIRARLAGLGNLAWSPAEDGSAFLICARKRAGKPGRTADEMKQGAIYKKAAFQADQLLKRLRRKAVIN
ncbi:MAG: hypothetical protein LBB08_02625 [Rickettsiales bacterium]|jgi:hypothetical protein|nr:hypothetical protein [Rickettsiales bacterium]